jgi:hypothetical protein
MNLLVKVAVQVVPLRILATISKANNFCREHFQLLPVGPDKTSGITSMATQ